MIGRADIEGSKSNVAMNAWLPQASYPCGNFSDTSSCNLRNPKGSIGHVFTVLYSYWKSKSSKLFPFWSTWDFCSHWAHLGTPALSFNRCAAPAKLPTWLCLAHRSLGTSPHLNSKTHDNVRSQFNAISKSTIRAVVFQCCWRSVSYTHLTLPTIYSV